MRQTFEPLSGSRRLFGPTGYGDRSDTDTDLLGPALSTNHALSLTRGGVAAAAASRNRDGNRLGNLRFGGGLSRLCTLGLRLGDGLSGAGGLGHAKGGAQGGGQRAVRVGLSPHPTHDEAILQQ